MAPINSILQQSYSRRAAEQKGTWTTACSNRATQLQQQSRRDPKKFQNTRQTPVNSPRSISKAYWNVPQCMPWLAFRTVANAHHTASAPNQHLQPHSVFPPDNSHSHNQTGSLCNHHFTLLCSIILYSDQSIKNAPFLSTGNCTSLPALLPAST